MTGLRNRDMSLEGPCLPGKASVCLAIAEHVMSHAVSTLQVALKLADVGHLCSPLPIHQRWTALLTEEFFRQGDRESLAVHHVHEWTPLGAPLLHDPAAISAYPQLYSFARACASWLRQCTSAHAWASWKQLCSFMANVLMKLA